MADISLCNRLSVSILRANFDKQSLALPPEEVRPNTTLTWHVEEEGAVTYDLSPERGEQGSVKRFTLQWVLSPDGEAHCTAQEVARALRIDVEHCPDGALCTVAPRHRRVPPPPRHSRLLTRLVPIMAGTIVVTLLGATLVALGSPFNGHPGSTPVLNTGRAAIASATASPMRARTTAPAATATARPSGSRQPSSPTPTPTQTPRPAPTATPTPKPTPTSTPTPTPPQLTVNPTQVGFGGACGPSVTATLGNAGQQTLNWSATATNGFILDSTGGSIVGGQSVTITISGTPADPSQPGYVNITSNGGNGTITVNYGCPF